MEVFMTTKDLHVCLVNDSFPPSIDGVANAVFNYASIIEEKYGHVVVSTPAYPDVIDDYPFEVLRYPSLDTTNFIGYRAGIPLDLNYLQQFSDKGIDIIHSHCPIASNFMARVLRDQIQKPIVFTYHTKFDIDIKRAVSAKLIQDAAIMALVSNIEPVDDVWVVSKGAGENLKSLGYKGEYTVMSNGVDFTKGKVEQHIQDEIFNEYSISHDKPIYLFVGRMMWYKGIKIILDALSIVKKHDHDFTMIFVGDGLEINEIKEYCSSLNLNENIIFTGAERNREKLKAFFSIADLFLFPSTFDTNGIVVREASACALGSVLIKGSCAAEDVTDKVNAILIDESSDSLAKFLLEQGSNLKFLHQIGENAQRDLYISWEDSVNHAVERYRYVIDKFEYKKPSILDADTSLLDNFFSFYADLANTLDKAKKTYEDLNTKFNDMLDRWL